MLCLLVSASFGWHSEGCAVFCGHCPTEPCLLRDAFPQEAPHWGCFPRLLLQRQSLSARRLLAAVSPSVSALRLAFAVSQVCARALSSRVLQAGGGPCWGGNMC